MNAKWDSNLSVESERLFDPKPLKNLKGISQFDAGFDSIFETSTPNLDMPACDTALKKVAFGQRFDWTEVSIYIHKRIMQIYSDGVLITNENLTNLEVHFENGRKTLLRRQKEWIIKWTSKDAKYKLTFYEEEDYKKFDAICKENQQENLRKNSVPESQEYVESTSTPKKPASSSIGLERILTETFAEIIPQLIAQIIRSVDNQNRHEYVHLRMIFFH